MSVLKSSVGISGFTLASRLLGFIRDILIAKLLGASAATDAFFVALRLPNMLRQLFAEGAFNVAFVPMLANKLETKGQQRAEKFATATFSTMLWFTVILSVVFMLLMDSIILIMAPGFADDPETFALAVDLSRITFPYFVFIVATSFMGGVLNTLKRFMAFAAAPMLLNFSFIVCLLTLPSHVPQPAFAAAWAVPIGGLLQVMLMVIAMRGSGFKLKLAMPHSHPKIKTLAKRIVPTFIGVGAQQINTLISTILASLLAPASISYLFYADRLSQLPLALIGLAIATALLPTLSRSLKSDTPEHSEKLLTQSLSVSIALGLAAACGLVFLAEEIMIVLFARGEFSLHDAKMSGQALAAFGVGLPAYIIAKITATAFYAREDTKTPVKTALISIGINLAAMLLLMPHFAHVGLAAATSIAAWSNVGMQLWLIHRNKIMSNPALAEFAAYSLKAFLVTAFMAGYLVFMKQAIPLPEDFLPKSIWLVGVIGSAVVLWGGSAFFTKLHHPLFAFRKPQPQK